MVKLCMGPVRAALPEFGGYALPHLVAAPGARTLDQGQAPGDAAVRITVTVNSIDKSPLGSEDATWLVFARLVVPGLPHHVTRRGNGWARTFFGDAA